MRYVMGDNYLLNEPDLALYDEISSFTLKPAKTDGEVLTFPGLVETILDKYDLRDFLLKKALSKRNTMGFLDNSTYFNKDGNFSEDVNIASLDSSLKSDTFIDSILNEDIFYKSSGSEHTSLDIALHSGLVIHNDWSAR
jgi:hypothetical protein